MDQYFCRVTNDAVDPIRSLHRDILRRQWPPYRPPPGWSEMVSWCRRSRESENNIHTIPNRTVGRAIVRWARTATDFAEASISRHSRGPSVTTYFTMTHRTMSPIVNGSTRSRTRSLTSRTRSCLHDSQHLLQRPRLPPTNGLHRRVRLLLLCNTTLLPASYRHPLHRPRLPRTNRPHRRMGLLFFSKTNLPRVFCREARKPLTRRLSSPPPETYPSQGSAALDIQSALRSRNGGGP